MKKNWLQGLPMTSNGLSKQLDFRALPDLQAVKSPFNFGEFESEFRSVDDNSKPVEVPRARLEAPILPALSATSDALTPHDTGVQSALPFGLATTVALGAGNALFKIHAVSTHSSVLSAFAATSEVGGALGQPLAYGPGSEHESGPTAAPQTSSAITKTGNPYIDGLLSGYKWSGSVTYSFPDAASDYEAGNSQVTKTGFAQISAVQQQAVHKIMSQLGSLTNLSIQFAGTDGADIRLAQSSAANPTSYAYYPGTGNGGDVWFGTQYNYRNPIPGDYQYYIHLHEIGHSLGLKHSNEAGGVANVAVPLDHDAHEFTVMSYRSYVGGSTGGLTNEGYGYPTTFMMNDILALQTMYGADYFYNNTNTTYSWSDTTGEMYVNGAGQGQPGANRVFLTIWDGGGIDTYDMSNYTNGVNIDLNPASWSITASYQQAYLGGGNYAHGTVYNSYLFNGDARSYIENAIGGMGGDIIVGNATANTLDGGWGDDTLTGGSGNDTFIYRAGYGADVITDFVAGGVDDVIKLYDIPGVATFGDVMKVAQQQGADTVFSFGAGQTLTLKNVQLGNLTSADFAIFSSAQPSTNQAPTGVALSNSALTEEITGATVGALSVTDPDGDVTFTFTLSDARFEVVNSTGAYQLKLKDGVKINYEAEPGISLTVTAADSGGLSISQSFALSVVNVNEAPSLTLSTPAAAVAENTSTAARIKMADIAIQDDTLGTNVLSLTGADASNFEIVGNSLYLKAGVVLDYETKASYAVSVNVIDAALGVTSSQSFALTVTDVNETLALNLTGATTSVSENTSTATQIKLADIAIVDTSSGNNTLSLSGTDAASFEVIGDSLYLKSGVSLNYEAKSSYAVTLNVTNSLGTTASQPFTLNVLDVNEAPALGLSSTSTSLKENTSTSSRIKMADIAIQDDALGTNALSLTGSDASYFEIVGNALYLKSGVALDYETKASYAVSVNVSDASLGTISSQSFTLGLRDVREAPTTKGRKNKGPESISQDDDSFVFLADLKHSAQSGDKSGFSWSGAEFDFGAFKGLQTALAAIHQTDLVTTQAADAISAVQSHVTSLDLDDFRSL